MVFSTDNLYRRENIDNNAPINNVVIKVSENTSLFIDSLHYIIEENILIENELSKYNLSTYREKKINQINEDKNININFHGPFERLGNGIGNLFEKIKTNFTIENIVRFIVTNFIKLIKRIWREFEVLCMNLVSKNSQIRRLDKKIKDIGVDIEYNHPMFIYTHTRDDSSRTDLEDQLNNIYNEIVSFIHTFKSIKNNAREIELAIEEFNNSKAYDEDNYSEIRGQLLGSNSLIDEVDYNEELFRYFRNNSSSASVVNIITPASIRQRYLDWENEPKRIRAYQRDRDKLEKAGNSLVSKLNKEKIDSYIKEVPANTLNLYSDLVNRYTHKIKNTCNIFLLFYAAKLDAAKDELALNKNILFKACQYIVKEGL